MAHFRPHLNAHGVTEQQWRILRALLEHGALEPRQLSGLCLISSPSITGVLARMEEAGLVRRTRMDHDQRRLSVAPTARGRQLGRRLVPRVEGRYDAIEALVGVETLQQVYDALDCLLQRLAEADADPGCRTAG
ncbi:MAG: MarR family transcriptional regulator [Proteobacteria bacterium]|nr:MarR family transcriptional regulator [Pseudomonadota bacterium]